MEYPTEAMRVITSPSKAFERTVLVVVLDSFAPPPP